jgi:hypothetical protein
MLNMQLIMEKDSLKEAKIIKEPMRYLKAKASELVESTPVLNFFISSM